MKLLEVIGSEEQKIINTIMKMAVAAARKDRAKVVIPVEDLRDEAANWAYDIVKRISDEIVDLEGNDFKDLIK